MVRNGLIEKADVAILGDKIERIAVDIQPSDNDKVYDCTGLTIMSGLVDLHVHLREPGFFYKETIETGSMAAAHGGYTAVCTMPNLNPVPDSAENLAEQLRLIDGGATIKVLPYGAITVEQKGERLSNMQAMANNVIAFSDDGRGVQSDEMMRKAMIKAKEV